LLNQAIKSILSFIKSHILLSHTETDYQKLQVFDWQLIVLTSFLVKIDGQYSFFEENKIKKTFLHFFAPEHQELAINAILIVKTENISWSDFIDEIKSNTFINDRIQIIKFLFEIGSIDGSLADEELSFIHSLSKDLGIVEIEFLKLLDKFKMWNKTIRSKILNQVNNTLENEKQQQKLRALTIFGLPHDASQDQIKKRYRELIKKHHPDAHPHLTASEMIFHKEQMFRINQAYEILV
jgi:uncharacterized tellurite resistance protein B-like protein